MGYPLPYVSGHTSKTGAVHRLLETGKKRCPVCDKVKPLEEFHLKSNKGKARYGYCRTCTQSYQRRAKLAHSFGLTEEEYEEIVRFQKGVCAICHFPPKAGGNRLSVDHDHVSGLIRGALCWKCNRALGYMKDDVQALRAMTDYLTSPPAVEALGREVYGQRGRVTNKRRTRRRTRKKAA